MKDVTKKQILRGLIEEGHNKDELRDRLNELKPEQQEAFFNKQGSRLSIADENVGDTDGEYLGVLVQGITEGVVPGGTDTVNKLASGVFAVGGDVKSVFTGDEPKSMDKIEAELLQRTKSFKENNPKTFMAASVAGLLLQSIAIGSGITGGLNRAGFGGLGVSGAFVGALEGGITGAINSAAEGNDLGTVVKDSLIDTALGGIAGKGADLITGKLALKKARKLRAKAVAETPELEPLFSRLDEVAEIKNSKITIETKKAKLAEVGQEITEKLTQMRAAAKEGLDGATTEMAELLGIVTDDIIENVSKAASEGSVEAMDAALTAYGSAMRSAKNALNVSYGSQLGEVVAKHNEVGTRVNVKDAFKVIKEDLVQQGILEPGSYKLIPEAIDSENKAAVTQLIKKITNMPDEVSFEEAIELKKYIGGIADFKQYNATPTRAYGFIRDALVKADKGVTDQFDAMSKAWKKDMEVIQGMSKAVGDGTTDTTLLNSIKSDLKNRELISGTKVSGRIDKLNKSRYDIFDNDAQVAMADNMKTIKNNLDVRGMTTKNKLQQRLKVATNNPRKVGDLRDALAQREVALDSFKALDEFEALPALHAALKNPLDKGLREAAIKQVKTLAPETQTEFINLYNRVAKNTRILDYPSTTSKVLKEIEKLDPEFAKQLGLNMDLVPEIAKLMDETTLFKMAKDQRIISKIDAIERSNFASEVGGGVLGYAAKAIDLATLKIPTNIVHWFKRMVAEPEVAAVMFYESGQAKSKSEARKMAAKMFRTLATANAARKEKTDDRANRVGK